MSALTRDDYVNELLNSGHHFLAPARAQRWLNEVVRSVLIKEQWPCRRKVAQVTSGATIPDLGLLREVKAFDGTTVDPVDRDELNRSYPGLVASGAPSYYWVDGGRTISTYPQDTNQITVVYFTRYPWTNGGMSAANGTDTLILPEEFDGVVQLELRQKALIEGDEVWLSETLESEIQELYNDLVANELNDIADEPQSIAQTRSWV